MIMAIHHDHTVTLSSMMIQCVWYVDRAHGGFTVSTFRRPDFNVLRAMRKAETALYARWLCKKKQKKNKTKNACLRAAPHGACITLGLSMYVNFSAIKVPTPLFD